MGQERTFSLKEEFENCIIDFTAKTEKSPKHIVIYRDRVFESYFQENLYEALEAAIKNCGLIEKPTITYIIMTKRHHVKFFAQKDDKEHVTGEVGNLKPGTLIESSGRHFMIYSFMAIVELLKPRILPNSQCSGMTGIRVRPSGRKSLFVPGFNYARCMKSSKN